MTCPRCGWAQAPAEECARCGVVVARWRPPSAALARRSASVPVRAADSGPGRTWWPAPLAFSIVAVAAWAWWLGAHASGRAVEPPSRSPERQALPTARRAVPSPAPALREAPAAPAFAPSPEAVSEPMPLPTASCPLLEGGVPGLPMRVGVSGFWREGAPGHRLAVQEQQRSKAPMLVYFFTDWCGFCKEFDREVLADLEVDRYLRTEVVKLKVNPENGSEERALAQSFGVGGYPSLFLVMAGGAPVRTSTTRRQDGTYPAGEFVHRLREAAARQAQSQLLAGRQRRLAGSPGDAVALLDEATALDPANPEVFLERGLARQQNGDPAGALDDFRAVLALDPQNRELFTSLGRALAEAKRWDESVACWTHLVDHDPDGGWARLERARSHQARGDRARARVDAEQACRSGEPAACQLLGRI